MEKVYQRIQQLLQLMVYSPIQPRYGGAADDRKLESHLMVLSLHQVKWLSQVSIGAIGSKNAEGIESRSSQQLPLEEMLSSFRVGNVVAKAEMMSSVNGYPEANSQTF